MSTPQEPQEPTESEPMAAPAPPQQPAQPTYPQAAPAYPAQPAAASSPYPPQPDATPPGYQQQYPQAAYPPPQYAQAPPSSGGKPKTWMNIVSLVTSIVGLGLIGVIFGHLGLSAAKRGEADLRGLGIAGLILGYVGIVLSIIATVGFLWWLSTCDPSTGECAGGFTWDIETG